MKLKHLRNLNIKGNPIDSQGKDIEEWIVSRIPSLFNYNGKRIETREELGQKKGRKDNRKKPEPGDKKERFETRNSDRNREKGQTRHSIQTVELEKKIEKLAETTEEKLPRPHPKPRKPETVSQESQTKKRKREEDEEESQAATKKTDPVPEENARAKKAKTSSPPISIPSFLEDDDVINKDEKDEVVDTGVVRVKIFKKPQRKQQKKRQKEKKPTTKKFDPNMLSDFNTEQW